MLSRMTPTDSTGRPHLLVSPLLHVALIVAALALWAWGVTGVDPERMGGLGLAPILPVQYYAAVLLLIVSFGLLVLNDELPLWLPALHFLALAIIWHATPALIYDMPRYQYTYKHLGIIDYIQRSWSIDPEIDAYFNWPGYFSLNAFVNTVIGRSDSFQIARWAPLFFNVIYIAPLLVLYRALSDHRRLVLIGTWIFMLTSWVGQDYFSPQALAFFWHLSLLAVYVTWFRTEPALRSERADERPAADPGQRAGLVLIMILAYISIVAGHQLTPIVTLSSVAALVLFNRTRLRLLPVLMLVLLLAWFAYPAATYLAGNLGSLVNSLGALLANLAVSAEISSVSSDPLVGADRALILSIRRWMTLLLWGLAALGGLRRFAGGRRDLTAALLALVPFSMIALGPYGGEMLLRIYVFSLPLIAWFVGALFVPVGQVAAPRWLAPGLMGLSVVLAIGNAFAYYGNEPFNYISDPEVAAFDTVYRDAPLGSLIVTAVENAPAKFARYEELEYESLRSLVSLDPAGPVEQQVQVLVDTMSSGRYPAGYVVFTRSQLAYALSFGIALPGAFELVQEGLADSPRFQEIYTSPDARVFLLVATEDVAP